MEDFGKQLPYNEGMESAVLGGVMIDSNSFALANQFLVDTDFYLPKNQLVYSACTNVYNRGQTIDLLSVNNELKTMGNLEEVGGVNYLMEITNVIFSASNIETHAAIIKDKSMKRQIISESSLIISECFKDEESCLDLMNQFDKAAIDLKNGNTLISDLKPKTEVVKSVIESMTTPSTFKGLPVTDIDELNKNINGARPGNLIIIAGRPGMGKSILSNSITVNLAKQGVPGVQWNLEMTKEESLERFVSSYSEIDFEDITRGRVNLSTCEGKINAAMDCYSSDAIYIEDRPGVNAMDLRSALFMYKNKHNIQYAIIDHGGLIRLEGGSRNDAAKIGEVTKLMKQTAKELDIPIFLLWQLNRSVESRGGEKMPQLSDLRGSGNIEEDADKIIFVHRPDYYGMAEPGEEDKAVLNVAKCRNGRLGYVDCKFDIKYARFSKFEEGFIGTGIPMADIPNTDIKPNREGVLDVPF